VESVRQIGANGAMSEEGILVSMSRSEERVRPEMAGIMQASQLVGQARLRRFRNARRLALGLPPR
jgi:hypothetical protein